jgi:tRNA-specific 2-thiouridylase
MLNKNKVVIGMSGGVDSSVAAYILKKQGYEVIGIHMKVWDEEQTNISDKGCCSIDSANDALRVCQKLDIPFYVVNFKEDFKNSVIKDFIEEYKLGRTPNPCIRCNKYLKFDKLMKKAFDLGAYYVATGHYAKIYHDENTKRFSIKFSNEDKKDQSYTLYSLSQDQLSHILMPLGEFSSKEEVREIAKELDVITSKKKDSQEICFIPDNDYIGFLRKNGVKEHSGNFIDKSNHILGKHNGVENFTIGQRKGLGISFGKPMYVVDLNSKTNQVVLGDNDDLFSTGLKILNMNFLSIPELKEGDSIECYGKIRYSAKISKAVLYNIDGEIFARFLEPQRAMTKGQSVVFSKDGILIGGGLIHEVYK